MPAGTWKLHSRAGTELPLQTDLHIDAVQVWDALSHQARHGVAAGQPAPSHWPVLLEFGQHSPTDGLDAWCSLRGLDDRAMLDLRAALMPSVLRATGSAVHSALFRPALVALLPAALRAGVLKRYELGDPLALGPVDPPLVIWSPPPTGAMLSTVGVVDRGFNPGHALWRDAQGGSRFASLWDQDPAPPDHPYWERLQSDGRPPPYGYGAELSGPSLTQALLKQPGLGQRNEAMLYQRLGRPEWGRAEAAPAAAVLDLLAADRGLPPAERDATRMPLLGVQLPPAAGGRGVDPLGLHALDAARHIVERTRASALGEGWNTTIVLAPGRAAGPHDGTSMAALGLSQLAADLRVNLVAAGGDAGQRRSHLCRVVHQDAPGRWLLRLPPGRTEETFVQVWLPAGQLADRFQFCLRGPDSSPSPLLRRGYALTLERADGLPRAGAIWPHQVAQGLSGSLVLLALAPTAARRGQSQRPLASPGLWQFEITAAGDAPAVVHAWIDACAEPDDAPVTDDSPGDDRRPATAVARFEPLDAADLAGETVGGSGSDAAAPAASHRHARLATLAEPGIASAAHMPVAPPPSAASVAIRLQGEGLSAACTLAQAAHASGVVTAVPYLSASRQLSPDASLGPARGGRLGTNARWVAPGALDANQGLPVIGRFSGQTAELSGSRAAAALVARWLCEGRIGEDVRRSLRVARPAADGLGPDTPGAPDATDWLDAARAVPGWAARRGGQP